MTKTTSTAPNNDAIHIGVYIPSDAQLLDTACVDIFAMTSSQYLSGMEGLLPAAIRKMAPRVEIYYIGVDNTTASDDHLRQDQQIVEMTAAMKVVVTHTTASPEVQPGKLDILLVPGPDPALRWGEEVLGFLRAHYEYDGEKAADILSICTGIFLCGEAGILGGKTVCGPRGLQGDIVKKHWGGGLRLVGDRYRWWRDGKVWSSGGVTNGNDLVAAYCRTSGKFPLPVVEVALEMAEVGERPQRYERGQVAVGLNFMWQTLRAVLGLGGVKKGKSA